MTLLHCSGVFGLSDIAQSFCSPGSGLTYANRQRVACCQVAILAQEDQSLSDDLLDYLYRLKAYSLACVFGSGPVDVPGVHWFTTVLWHILCLRIERAAVMVSRHASASVGTSTGRETGQRRIRVLLGARQFLVQLSQACQDQAQIDCGELAIRAPFQTGPAEAVACRWGSNGEASEESFMTDLRGGVGISLLARGGSAMPPFRGNLQPASGRAPPFRCSFAHTTLSGEE